MFLCINTTYDLCVNSTQTRCIRLTHAYDSCTSPQSSLPWLQSSIIKTQTSKEAGLIIQPRKRSLHIIQWWDVLTLRSVCISQCAMCEWALALFRNNHRACVLKRNTLELIIHWKRNMSIYSLRHLLCNQPVFLYISPVLDWLLEWIRLLDHCTENFPAV